MPQRQVGCCRRPLSARRSPSRFDGIRQRRRIIRGASNGNMLNRLRIAGSPGRHCISRYENRRQAASAIIDAPLELIMASPYQSSLLFLTNRTLSSWLPTQLSVDGLRHQLWNAELTQNSIAAFGLHIVSPQFASRRPAVQVPSLARTSCGRPDVCDIPITKCMKNIGLILSLLPATTCCFCHLARSVLPIGNFWSISDAPRCLEGA